MASTIECYVKDVHGVTGDVKGFAVPAVHLTFVALYRGIGYNNLNIVAEVATVAEHRDPLSIHT